MLKEIRIQNLDILSKNGFQLDKQLPLLDKIVSSRNAHEIRSRIEVMLVLNAISIEGSDSFNFFKGLITDLKSTDFLSSEEKKVLSKKLITKQNLIDFSWYKESISTLLWSVSSIDSLDLKLNECDIADFYPITPPEFESSKFHKSLNLKTIPQLTKELDLYYLLNSYLRSSNDLIKHSIVIERRRALEWILNTNTDWHSISLDT